MMRTYAREVVEGLETGKVKSYLGDRINGLAIIAWISGGLKEREASQVMGTRDGATEGLSDSALQSGHPLHVPANDTVIRGFSQKVVYYWAAGGF